MAACPICGQAVPDGERWCPNCGADVLQARGGIAPPSPAPAPAAGVQEPSPAAVAAPPAAPMAPAEPALVEPAPAEQKLGGVVILPDNTELPVTTVNRIFGRADFAKYISGDDASYISRKHVSVFEEQSKFYVRDEGSTNGSKVNGVDIKGKGKYELHDGDLIDVADVVKLNFRVK